MKKRARPGAALVLTVTVLLATACGASTVTSQPAEITEQAEATTETTTTASPTSEPKDVPERPTATALSVPTEVAVDENVGEEVSEVVGPEVNDPDTRARSDEGLAAVVASVERTLQKSALHFQSTTRTTLPAFDIDGSSYREGSFDLDTFSGSGGYVLEADPELVAGLTADVRESFLSEAGTEGADRFDSALDDLFEAGFELLLVDDVFWQHLPLEGKERQWLGLPLDTLLESGSDPTGAMYGGIYLWALLEPDLVVFESEPTSDELPEGWSRWSVAMSGDLFAPSVTSGGVVTRLYDAGFTGVTGVLVPATVDIDGDGYVRGLRSDVSNWWLTAYRQVDIPVTDMTVEFDLVLSPLESLVVEAPCVEPTVEVDEAGDEALLCE